MWKACQLAGMDVPSDVGTRKMYCPFGDFSHSDGGDEPAFRVYSNHAFCFACWAYYTPVKICAVMWDVDEERAAGQLLDATGISTPRYTDRWEQASKPPEVDRDALAAALRTRCELLGADFYHPQVSQYLARCLGWLSRVTTEEEARHWLDTCAQVIKVVNDRSAG